MVQVNEAAELSESSGWRTFSRGQGKDQQESMPADESIHERDLVQHTLGQTEKLITRACSKSSSLKLPDLLDIHSEDS